MLACNGSDGLVIFLDGVMFNECLHPLHAPVNLSIQMYGLMVEYMMLMMCLLLFLSGHISLRVKDVVVFGACTFWITEVV